MSEIKLLAIDLAKRVFQLHGVDASGNVVLERRVMRDQLEPLVAGLAACEIVMEACGSAHDWGRRSVALGHRVRLLPPVEVSRLVDRRKKNDRRDVRAIALAARLEHVRAVPLKSAQAQAEQFEHRMRARLITTRTSLINLLRAMLLEFGIVIAKGPQALNRERARGEQRPLPSHAGDVRCARRGTLRPDRGARPGGGRGRRAHQGAGPAAAGVAAAADHSRDRAD
jgi:transposase